jgi:2-amino-4-hydroxy-6-hydroxymethyldihydropteridine diphosphokinase
MGECIYYISLGSNIGNRFANILQALEMICELPQVKAVLCSSIYETEAVLPEDAPHSWNTLFLNAVARLTTVIEEPTHLLTCLQGIEEAMGRSTVRMKNAPRSIDLDILFAEHCTSNTECLQMPHPKMYERLFVLVPLQELRQEI